MPRIRPLTPAQAQKTLAHRFTRTADKLRQLATNFGVRPYRVFLIWTKWSGAERGEGDEVEVKRIEILPTPRVASLDNLSFSLVHAGTIPVGSLRVDRISGANFTQDILQGHVLPREHEDHVPEPYEFFYEVVEDGREGPPAGACGQPGSPGNPLHVRAKFRLLNVPARRAGKVDWTVMLERVSEDRNRRAQSQIGTDTE